jgi:hypothetical protein
MGKKWWEYICMVDGCSHGGKNVHDGRKGSQTLRTGTKYLLGVIEWQRRRVAVFFQETYDGFPSSAKYQSIFPVDVVRVQVHLNGLQDKVVQISRFCG